MHRCAALGLLALLVSLAAPAGLKAQAPSEFRWHEFLGPWERSAPSPKGPDRFVGLRTDYLDGELAYSRPGAGRPAKWVVSSERSNPRPNGAVMFSSQSDHVSYARVRFLSAYQQEAVLSVGADDGVVAFLNGERVLESPEISNIYLDHYRVPVTLQKGENVLLLKVENWGGPCGAIARLLPPIAKPGVPPTLEVRAIDPVDRVGDAPLPRLQISFLDAGGKLLGASATDGFRLMTRRPQDFVTTGGWRWYGAIPAGTVRVRLAAEWDLPGAETMVLQQTEHPWTAAAGKALEFGGPTLSAEGSVRGEDGKPLAEAHFFDSRSGQPLPAEVRPDGTFVLRGLRLAGDHRISVGAPGYRTATLKLLPPYLEPLDLTLQTGARSVRGLVRGNGGTPLSHAIVTARGRRGEVIDSFETGPDGIFRLSGLELDSVRISVTADADRYLPLDAELALGSLADERTAPPKEFQLQLRPGATITGTVRSGESGKPAADVRLFSRENEFAPGTTTESGRDGRFRLSGVAPGKAKVFALSEDFAPSTVEVPTELWKDSETTVTVNRGRAITGRIVDEAGEPIRGAVAYIVSWNGVKHLLHRTCRSDLQGRFEIPHMPADDCVIEFMGQGYGRVRREGLKGGDEIVIVLKRE